MAPNGPFLYTYITALVLVELLLGLAFAMRARLQRSRRFSFLAAAYVWSAPLALANFIALPQVEPELPFVGLQVAPALWLLWHAGWLVFVGGYAFSEESTERRTAPLVTAAFAGAVVAGLATAAINDRLPPLIAPDEHFLPLLRGAIGMLLAGALVVLFQVLRRVESSGDRLAAIAVGLAAVEATLMMLVDVRYDPRFYAARFVNVAGSFTMLGAFVAFAFNAVRTAAFERSDRERLEEFRVIADAMPQIVWRLDAAGRNIYANARWSEYTGRERRDGRDDAFLEAIHPDDRAGRDRFFDAAVGDAKTYEATYRVRAADGSYRYFLTRAEPIVRGGVAVGWVGTSTDIDGRVRLEQQQRAAYEREAQDAVRMRVVAAIGRALAGSLERDVILRTAVTRLIPDAADAAIINLRDETSGELRVAMVHHRDADEARRLGVLVGHSYVRSDARGGSEEAASSGSGMLRVDVTQEFIRSTVRPEFAPLFESFGFRSAVIVPLLGSEIVRGTLSLNYGPSQRRYVAEDAEMIEEIGRRIALALENAEHYARERRVADRLQHASLPAALPAIAGWTLDAVYQAGRSEAQIGGDWYDAFELGDGRLVVGVGDVMGSGLDSAVTMGAVRQAIRGAAEVLPDPAAILDAVDRALAKSRPDWIVTAFLGIVDRSTLAFTYASAGHPPPMVRGSDGRVTLLDGGGLPIGLRAEQLARGEVSRRVQLEPGALLVLYTDGLTEATRDAAAGEGRLRDALRALGEDDRSADAIRRAVLGESAIVETHDDVAILTLRVEAPAVAGRTTFDCDARDGAAVRTVRRSVDALLADAGTNEADRFQAELALGELLANVARHTPGIAQVVLDLSNGDARLRVLDRGPGFTRAVEMPQLLAESGRGLGIVAQLARALAVRPRPGGGTEVDIVLAFDGSADDRERAAVG